MIEAGPVGGAEFHRGKTSFIDVFLIDEERSIYLFETDIGHCSKQLSKNEIDTVIELLLRKKELMSREGDFPPIYDEMLSDLITAYKERYGKQVWKGKDRNSINWKCHYTLSIYQLEALIEQRYKFTRVRIDSVTLGKNDSSMTKVEVEPEGSLFVSFSEVEEDE